jgi:hypothetical protein
VQSQTLENYSQQERSNDMSTLIRKPTASTSQTEIKITTYLTTKYEIHKKDPNSTQ